MPNQVLDFHAENIQHRDASDAHRVLVVDDDPIVRRALSEILGSSGYICDQAESAYEALRCMEKRDYACVLTDLVMPGMSGIDLLQEVINKYPETAVVLVSGQSDVGLVRQAMRNGAYDYVVKPSTAAELLGTVGGALKKRAQHLQELSDKAHLQERAELGMVESLLFEDIVRSTIDGIMITDLKGRIIMVNPAFERLTGYSRDELLGRIAPVFKTASSADEQNLGIVRALASKGFWSGELIDRRKDQSKWYGHISITRVKDPKGRAFADVFIVRDISDKKFMERQLIEKLHEVQLTQDAAILGFAKLAEYRDRKTGGHLERVRNYCKVLAAELARMKQYAGILDEAYVEGIYKSSPLHDIGKVGMPDSILLKPGRLTGEEYEVMKNHTILGGDTLASVEVNLPGKSFLSQAKEIAYYHHEKFNGTGYPFGLSGTAIPLSARIVAFADAYDALTSRRVYKDVVSPEESKRRLLVDRGRHFDPEVVDAFLASEKEFKEILFRFSDKKS